MSEMTTTQNGFKIIDVTFRGARRQCEIENEIDSAVTTVSRSEIVAPVSCTPEQVKDFFRKKCESTPIGNEKKVYNQTIKWIDELAETKKKLFALENKQVTEVDKDEDIK